jgi:hypothetical protein
MRPFSFVGLCESRTCWRIEWFLYLDLFHIDFMISLFEIYPFFYFFTNLDARANLVKLFKPQDVM